MLICHVSASERTFADDNGERPLLTLTNAYFRPNLTALEEENPASSDDVESATPPKRISLTDPAARYTAAPGGPAFFAYSTNYLIDLHPGIIVDVEATPAHRTQELESTKTMVERVEQRFNLKPQRLVGDTAYGTGAMLGWMVQEKHIDPHVPVWQRPRSDGTFPISDFQWLEQANEYRCPAGHALRSDRRQFKEPRSHITKADTIIYRSSQPDCATCAMKQRCCPNTPMRKIVRSVHEAARDEARVIANTPAYKRHAESARKSRCYSRT